MRPLARLLFAVLTVPALLLPQGGTYCLYRLVGAGDPPPKAACAACCCHAERGEHHAAPGPIAAPDPDHRAGLDTCCVALPELGAALDSTAQVRHDAELALALHATPLVFAPDDFATSVVADGRFAVASRGPPDAPRPVSVPIALPLRL